MTQRISPEELIGKLLTEALKNAEQGLIAKANKALVLLYDACKEFPFLFWDNREMLDLAKAFTVMYHFDTFDNEEENIEVTHWAYLYAYRSMLLAKEWNDQELLFQSLKELALLTDTCNEAFIHSASQFYLPKQEVISKEQKQSSLMLADRVMPLVTYSFILEIEDTFNSFKEDEFLEEVCNKIESDFESISDKLAQEGKNISILLFRYIVSSQKSQ